MHAHSISPAAPKLISVTEAAERLGLCRTTTYKLIREKQIRAVKIGVRTLIDVESMHSFVDSLPQFQAAS